MSLTILSVIPFIVFGLALVIIFLIFLRGVYLFTLSGNYEAGKEEIIKSLYFFVIFVLAFLVFSGITYLVKKGEIFNPAPATGEFPASPTGEFPPAPEIVEDNNQNNN